VTDFERPRFPYHELDYAALVLLERQQKVSGLYAGGLVCCSELKEIYLHKRSAINVDRDASRLHTMSGNFCPRRAFDPDKSLGDTATREIREEMNVQIDIDAIRFPAVLIEETFLPKHGTYSGRLLLSYLGLDISRDLANRIKDSDEGEVLRLKFDDLLETLIKRSDWMRTGLLNILVWLSLDAFSYGAGPGFDAHLAQHFLKEWFQRAAVSEHHIVSTAG
jgi:hypothetical protein